MNFMKMKLWKASISFALLVLITIPRVGLSQILDDDGEMVPYVNNMMAANFHNFKGIALSKIPIVVPPGRAGMAPNLALTYNSNKRNGVIGIGWDLDLGYIQRSTKRGVCYDSERYNPDCETTECDDPSCVDENFNAYIINGGIELVSRATDWGDNYYGAKIENEFTKYYHDYDGSSNEDNGWIATKKDGTKYYYGTEPGTYESRQDDDPDNPTKIFKWYLEKIVDTNGDYMQIFYLRHKVGVFDYNQIYPDEIRYTGSYFGDTLTNVIKFHYDERRSDPLIDYSPKFRVATHFLLKTIEITSRGNLVRAYSLTYDLSGTSFSSLLSSVQEFGNDASVDESDGVIIQGDTPPLPPIQIRYTKETDGLETTDYWGFTLGRVSSHRAFVDVNGDGRSDFVYKEYLKSNLWVMLSNGTEFVTDTTQSIKPVYSTDKSCFGDLDGDGKADFVYQSKANENQLYVMLASDSGEDLIPEGSPWGTLKANLSRPYKLVDMNGDGKMDFVYVSVFNNCFKIHILYMNAAGDGFEEDQSWSTYPGPDGLIEFGDLNGDGMPDVIYKKGGNERMMVKLSNGAGFEADYWCADYSDDDKISEVHALVDVNGDGLSDFVYKEPEFDNDPDLEPESEDIHVWLSDGTKFVVGPAWCRLAHEVHGSSCHFVDLNGDGMADIVYRKRGTNQWWARFSRGHAFGGEVLLGHNDARGIRDGGAAYGFADVNGDGKIDLAYNVNGTSNNIHVMESKQTDEFGQPIAPMLMTSISNRMGGIDTFEYEPSSQCEDQYLPFIVHTVSSSSKDDGVSSPSTINYSYSGGFYDFLARDFRGFSEVTETLPPGFNQNQGKFIITRYNQGEYSKGREYEVEVRVGDEEGPLLSKTILDWVEEPQGDSDSYFVQLDKKTEEIYDGDGNEDPDVAILEDYTYWDYSELGADAHGSLYEKTISGIEGTNLDDPVTESFLYQNYDSGGWMWRKIQETVNGLIEGGQTEIVRQTNYDYFSNSGSKTGNLQYKDLWYYCWQTSEPATTYRTEMDYDSYGNLSWIKDARGKETSYEYENTAETFVSSITYPKTNNDTVEHVVEYPLYDYRYGKKKREEDENDNITYYDYDAFGRLKQVDYPDVGQTKTEYYDYIAEYDSETGERTFYTPSYIISKVKESDTSFIEKHEHFDGMGKKIQTFTFGEFGQPIVSRMYYDNLGQNYRVEGPFEWNDESYSSVPSQAYPWAETQFDYHGRPLIVKSPVEGAGGVQEISTNFSYNGLSTTITDPDNCKKTETKDILGRLTEIIEYPHTGEQHTNYTYNASGDLLSVKKQFDGSTIDTLIYYDSLGQKRKMIDPDMGEWDYTYDENGNLQTQTDAESQTITFGYDTLNRVESKTYSTGDSPVTYSYDRDDIVPNGKGRIYSVSNTNVITTYEEYDEMGREKKVKKEIIEEYGTPPTYLTYTTEYTYDKAGRLETILYPNDNSDLLTLTYDYHPGSGLIASVMEDNYSFADFSNYLSSGEIGNIDYGNNASIQYDYDLYSTRLKGYETTDSVESPDTTVFDKRAYKYSDAGDIVEIIVSENSEAITYTYHYDNLHRLFGETRSPEIATTTATELNYTYAGNQIHAPSIININGTDRTIEYDANGNVLESWDFDLGTERRFTDAGGLSMYNGDNMPTEITHGSSDPTQFIYDGEGVRAKKINPNDSEVYYIGDHFEVQKSGSSKTEIKYIFGGNLRVAMIKGSDDYYFHKDHLGSSTVITDDGTGEEIGVSQGNEYMPFGMDRSNEGDISNYKFTDQEHDQSTGLYNYDARLYDPVIGMFVMADTVVPDPTDPQSLNRYSYCRNNPLIYVDPNGHIPFDNGDSYLWDNDLGGGYNNNLDQFSWAFDGMFSSNIGNSSISSGSSWNIGSTTISDRFSPFGTDPNYSTYSFAMGSYKADGYLLGCEYNFVNDITNGDLYSNFTAAIANGEYGGVLGSGNWQGGSYLEGSFAKFETGGGLNSFGLESTLHGGLFEGSVSPTIGFPLPYTSKRLTLKTPLGVQAVAAGWDATFSLTKGVDVKASALIGARVGVTWDLNEKRR